MIYGPLTFFNNVQDRMPRVVLHPIRFPPTTCSTPKVAPAALRPGPRFRIMHCNPVQKFTEHFTEWAMWGARRKDAHLMFVYELSYYSKPSLQEHNTLEGQTFSILGAIMDYLKKHKFQKHNQLCIANCWNTVFSNRQNSQLCRICSYGFSCRHRFVFISDVTYG